MAATIAVVALLAGAFEGPPPSPSRCAPLPRLTPWPCAATPRAHAGGAQAQLADAPEGTRWDSCAELASCLGLEPAPDVEVRITLNLMFVGFQGDGNLGAAAAAV